MDIRWFGQSFFEVTFDTEVKKGVKIYFDPYSESIGLVPPSGLEADIVFVSHQHSDHNNLKLFKKIGLVVDTPGEYSAKGIDAKGILTFHDNSHGSERGSNVVFLVKVEGISLAHLGDLGHVFDENQIRKIGTPEVLMIPVGGNYSINGKEAAKIIKQLESKIVIPMHYKIPGIKAELNGIEKFCQEAGICVSEPLNKVSVKAGNLTNKEMEVVILKAQNL